MDESHLSSVYKFDRLLSSYQGADKRYRIYSNLDIITEACCKNKCNWLFSIYELSYGRLALPIETEARRTLQFTYLLNALDLTNKERIKFFSAINAKPFCPTLFQRIYMVPESRFLNFLRHITDGYTEAPPHGNTNMLYNSKRGAEQLSHLVVWLDSNCEPHPADNSYFLPAQFTRKEAFHLSQPPKSVLPSRSGSTITDNFKKVRKVRCQKANTFLKCKDCTLLADVLKKQFLDTAARNELLLLQAAHRQQIRRDRADYEAKKLLSKVQNNRYLSICHDGMTQEKTKLPRFVDQPKNLADNDKIGCSLNLSLVHRTDDNDKYLPVGFFNFTQAYAGGTNLIASQIIETLNCLPAIPPTLFLQLDNCSSNKSYLMLGVWAYVLLAQKSLKEVHLSFMPPGHTHNDVDALFGTFSKQISRSTFKTPSELIKLYKSTIGGEHAFLEQNVWDFTKVVNKSFIDKAMKDAKAPITSNYHFHLYVNNSSAFLKTEPFELTQKWIRNSDDPPIGAEPTAINLTQAIDLSLTPSPVKPDEEHLSKTQKMLRCMRTRFSTVDNDEYEATSDYLRNYQTKPIQQVFTEMSNKSVGADLVSPKDTPLVSAGTLTEEILQVVGRFATDPDLVNLLPVAALPKNPQPSANNPKQKKQSKKQSKPLARSKRTANVESDADDNDTEPVAKRIRARKPNPIVDSEIDED